jgi:hypothetical protein
MHEEQHEAMLKSTSKQCQEHKQAMTNNTNR